MSLMNEYRCSESSETCWGVFCTIEMKWQNECVNYWSMTNKVIGLYKNIYFPITNILILQSWEKTMDSYSPGQGLMPASFKVRTVPLDGDDSATEEVLDPDFGEAAIGRVAPVDSGNFFSKIASIASSFSKFYLTTSPSCSFFLLFCCFSHLKDCGG